ncbi:MAG: hypothetical protein APR53_08040 [Methanoculleus sp. SDB]|nr:MAG: hypothetical protein APR53_08040 [Methanoculleus sp. SDB]
MTQLYADSRRIAPANRDDWETGRIWEEAGFTPPLRHRGLVELLHRLGMGDYSAAAMLALSLARAPCDDTRVRITDPGLLARAARQFGISTAERTDEAIARDVADAVIDEYAEPHHHSVHRSGHA